MKITPCLWFDNEAEEAAKFYVSIFPNSKIKYNEKYTTETPSNKPIGSVMTVTFELDGNEFMGLNGGDYFKINPSVSFTINCKSVEEVDNLWEKLSRDGKVLMELAEYPFSKKYGWLEDKYGVSWQLIVREDKQKIMPSLMFIQENNGMAKEAIDFYTNIFKNSKVVESAEYEEGEGNTKGYLKYSRFSLDGKDFIAMDGGVNHKFNFNEAISFIITCKNQEEIDYYYDKLSAVPEAEVCGWLKDKYGVSWQLIPEGYDEMMNSLDEENKKKVMEALLKMKRIDMNELERAREEK